MSRWWILGLAVLLVPLFFLLPLIALAWRGGASFAEALADPALVAAVRLSFVTSLGSTLLAIVTGTPLAWALARYRFRGRMAVETVVDLPIVLPPAVAGIGLLMAFGRRGLVGQYLGLLGVEIAFTPLAVVLAQFFVAAPLYVRAAVSAFRTVDPRWMQVAATLGASPWRIFRQVALPLAAPTLFGGIVLCWARALGEFGATIMFAGSLIGRTQTMPLAIYAVLERDLDVALAIALLLVLLSFAFLILLRSLAEVDRR